MPTPDPTYDLVAWVEHEQSSGDNEVDPYGYAVTLIKVALEFALDDGISGAMSRKEYEILEAIAMSLTALDPAIEINPRPA